MVHTAVNPGVTDADLNVLILSEFVSAVAVTESLTTYSIYKRSTGITAVRVATYGEVDVLTEVTMSTDSANRLYFYDDDRMVIRSTPIRTLRIFEN